MANSVIAEIIIYHDPAIDRIESEHIACPTLDYLVAEFARLYKKGLRPNSDFNVIPANQADIAGIKNSLTAVTAA